MAGNAIANAVYRWHDLNGNLDYDPGEVNLDRNGPDFVETVGRLSQGTAYLLRHRSRGEPGREAAQVR